MIKVPPDVGSSHHLLRLLLLNLDPQLIFLMAKKMAAKEKKITYSLVPVNPREKITHVASCGSSIFGLEII